MLVLRYFIFFLKKEVFMICSFGFDALNIIYVHLTKF